jgi:hypothetical protein
MKIKSNMNKKIIFMIFLLSCSIIAWIWISNSARSNQTEISEAALQPDNEVKRSDTDVLPRERIEAFQNVADDMRKILMEAPDDSTGKQSPWFKILSECQLALSQAARTGTRKDLFAIIPPTATFFARDREVDDLSQPLDDLRHRLEVVGVPIIKELAIVVTENNGTLDEATAELAIKVFSVSGFSNEPDWEDEIEGIPINAAGVLIARPEIVPLLEAMPDERLDFFVSGDTPEKFYWRYLENSDGKPKRDIRFYGLPILRKRYSENRDNLHEYFNRLADKVAPYRAKLYKEE